MPKTAYSLFIYKHGQLRPPQQFLEIGVECEQGSLIQRKHYLMTSKKPAKLKRAKQPRSSDKTKQFSKDWERLSHSGRYDMNRLKEAMMLLIANDEQLPPEYLDHELTGDIRHGAGDAV